VDDPSRVGQVTALGVDETSWLTATKDHPTLFATGLVDLRAKIVIDVVQGNSAKDLGSWLDRQPAPWLAGVRAVATDLAESGSAARVGDT
ncbi:MAG: transposase, partial [Acidimicrobiia bacterium]